MSVDVIRARVVEALEDAVTDAVTDENDSLNRAAIIMQEDGSIAIATWQGNLYLLTVQEARCVVRGD